MTAMALSAVWPATAYSLNWSNYRDPMLVGALLVVAVGLPLILCWLGPRGLGMFTSALAVVTMAGLELLLPTQTIDLARSGAHWIDGCGATVVIVLVFSRPFWEVVLSVMILVASNVAALTVPAGPGGMSDVGDLLAGGMLLAAVCAVALVGALRRALSAARQARAVADQAYERRAILKAIQRERRLHFARWEEAVAPFLEDVAAGRRSPADHGFAAECGRLARSLRQELADRSDSLIEVLLRDEIAGVRSRGGNVVINDLDVGHRVSPETRVELVKLIRELCAQDSTRDVQLALLAGDSEDRAVAVLSVVGAGVPDSRVWRAAREAGTVTFETPDRWWWDLELRCERVPAIGYRAVGTTVGR